VAARDLLNKEDALESKGRAARAARVTLSSESATRGARGSAPTDSNCSGKP